MYAIICSHTIRSWRHVCLYICIHYINYIFSMTSYKREMEDDQSALHGFVARQNEWNICRLPTKNIVTYPTWHLHLTGRVSIWPKVTNKMILKIKRICSISFFIKIFYCFKLKIRLLYPSSMGVNNIQIRRASSIAYSYS